MKFIEESYSLPLTLAGGISYTGIKKFLFSADLKHYPYDSRTTLSFGAEFSPVSFLSLRSGYIANSAMPAGYSTGTEQTIANLNGLGFGLGLSLGFGTIDYSVTPAGELGNAQRLSLSIKF